MLYKVIAVSYLSFAASCDIMATSVCIAGLTFPTDITSPTKGTWCPYMEGYMQCIITNSCCEEESVEEGLNMLKTPEVEALGCNLQCSNPPCFGRDTHATLATGERVLMSSLQSGDYVLPGPTRVIVNQHKNAPHLTSSLLDIEHADGSLKLTPDHVLSVDGSFVAAREATVGTKLGESVVSRVSHSAGGIINPLTTSGTIVADGVLASTYPEWIAGWALAYPVHLTAGNFLSFLFPATTQAYYDAMLESFFQSTSSSLVSLKGVLPAPLVALVFICADLAISVGLVLFSLTSVKSVLALAMVAATTKGRK